MGLEKLLNKLGKLLDEQKKGKKADCDDIAELLSKLKKKKAKIASAIDEEKSGSKRKKLKLELKITQAELKKGEKIYRNRCR